MPITPNHEAVLTITQLMAKTLGVLHEIIEIEYEHPKEVMVLMMAFITGITMQLKEKMEVLELGLGEQLLDAVGKTINPTGRVIIEKLNKNDPSLKESTSGIASDDLPKAIDFLVTRLFNDIKIHLNELPYSFRNDITILHSLSAIAGVIFNNCETRDLDTFIEDFSKGIRIFADKKKQNSTFDQKRH